MKILIFQKQKGKKRWLNQFQIFFDFLQFVFTSCKYFVNQNEHKKKASGKPRNSFCPFDELLNFFIQSIGKVSKFLIDCVKEEQKGRRGRL